MIECQMNPRELDANLSFNYFSTYKLVISLMLQHPKSFQLIMMPFIVVVGMSQLSIDRLPRQN
jgi:hypothetical protein